jgi:hypothetical protein
VPEKTEVLDEAVKVDREQVVVVFPISDYSTTPSPTDIFIFKTFSYKSSLFRLAHPFLRSLL